MKQQQSGYLSERSEFSRSSWIYKTSYEVAVGGFAVLLAAKVPKEKILMIGWIATKIKDFLVMTINAKTLDSGRLKSTLLLKFP